MEYDVQELREKIDNYFSGILSKEELGRWAGGAYLDLLRGGYVEIKKITLYPFLKTISTFHIEDNPLDDEYPCSKGDIREIQNVLHGEREFHFQVEMSIPLQVYNMFLGNPHYDLKKRERFAKIQNEIFYLLQGKVENYSNIAEYLNMNLVKKNETVQDILEEHILKLCKVLFEVSSSGIKRKSGRKIYPQKTSSDYLTDMLNNYLECYQGKRNFNIVVSFQCGTPEILLLI